MISVSISDIGELSDDQIAEMFTRRDGRWSSLTKGLMRRFGVHELDLNEAWANESQDWTCPACSRGKAEIVRVTTRKVLFARLEMHHDHLHDYMSAKLRSEFGTKWPESIPEGTYHLEHSGARLLQRFEETVICADCNSVDAEVKHGCSEIHRSFSFRPSEIASFISIHPNRRHVSDVDMAIKIWRAASEDFEERLKVANDFLARIRNGELAQVPNRHLERSHNPFDFVRLELQNHTARDIVQLYAAVSEMRSKLLKRSISTA